MLLNPEAAFQVSGSWTFSYLIRRLEICLSAHPQVMLDQGLERAHMAIFNGGLLSTVT